jgi:hypothetical protein
LVEQKVDLYGTSKVVSHRSENFIALSQMTETGTNRRRIVRMPIYTGSGHSQAGLKIGHS